MKPFNFRKLVSFIVLVAFVLTTIKSPAYAQVLPDKMPLLPAPGAMVHLSTAFTPALLKGIIIHPENALKFDFIIYKGDQVLSGQEKRTEYTKLIKYFLASLAVPDDDQWVNLSPYEKDRIIKEDFGRTEMGRDLLAQDYILKQVTASLIYPQDKLGQKFWDRVYAKAYQRFGTTNIPVNTFNKVWILPDDAQVFEKGNMVYVLKNHLKVMLEEDYLSLNKHSGIQTTGPVGQNRAAHQLGSQVVREIVLPALEQEVNEGKNFAPLRQVFSGVVLAAWYKRALKESFLGKVYMNKSRLRGVDQDPKNNEIIYQQYLKAFKKGVFNFIKEDVNKYSNETIPRKYFSGGAVAKYSRRTLQEDAATKARLQEAVNDFPREEIVRTVGLVVSNGSKAMTTDEEAREAVEDSTLNGLTLSDRRELLAEARNLTSGTRSIAAIVYRLLGTYSRNLKAQKQLEILGRKLVRIELARRGNDEFDVPGWQEIKTKTAVRTLFFVIAVLLLTLHFSSRSKVYSPAKNDMNISTEAVDSSDWEQQEAVLQRYVNIDGMHAEAFSILVNMNNNKDKFSTWLLEKAKKDYWQPQLDFLEVNVNFGDPNGTAKEILREMFENSELLVQGMLDDAKEYYWRKGKLAALKSYIESESLDAARGIYEEMQREDPWKLPRGVLDEAEREIKDHTHNSQAMLGEVEDPGGIDLNTANWNLRIKVDGKGVPLPLAQQDMAQLSGLAGIEPVILQIQPALQSSFLSKLITKSLLLYPAGYY